MVSKKGRKKPGYKRPKVPAATREEAKEKSAGATGKADTVISDEEISDKPAGDTLATTEKESKQGSTEPPCETSAAPTTKTSELDTKNPSSGETRATTKEPPTAPVGISNEDDEPLSPGILSEDEAARESLKRKRANEEGWTESTYSPVPKSPKLDDGQ